MRYDEYIENPVHKTLKQRKKKKLKKKVKIFFFFVIVSLVIVFFCSNLSKVKSIQINGLESIEKKDITSIISIQNDSYYFLIDKDKVKEEILQNPSVKNAKIQIDYIGNVTISIDEALPIAYALVDTTYYEINDVGHVVEIKDQQRLQSLKTLSYVTGFSDLEMLEDFAKGFKDVPSLMQNEMSEIILDPQPADPTRLKCLLNDNKTLYVRIEDLATRLNDDQFSYEAYKTEYSDSCIFSIEGKFVYKQKCQ